MGEISRTLEIIKQTHERMLVIITEAMDMTSDNEVGPQSLGDWKSPRPLLTVSTASSVESSSAPSGRLVLFPHTYIAQVVSVDSVLDELRCVCWHVALEFLTFMLCFVIQLGRVGGGEKGEDMLLWADCVPQTSCS